MKKLILATCAALLSLSAVATTLNPIQLLNPAGSTSGQAIVSTGATTAPAWGNVSISTLTGILPVAKGGTNTGTASGTALDNITGFSGTGFMVRAGGGAYSFLSATNGIGLGNLTQVTANTVLANATGSTANLAAFSMPSCSTSVSALNWTTSTGFTCNTGLVTAATVTSTYAPIAGTAGIAAASGNVGQHQTFGNTVGAVSLPSAVATNCFSQSLTAGSYQLSGVINITAGAGNTMSFPTGGLSTTSLTLGAFGTFTQLGATFAASSSAYLVLPTVYFDLTTTTTVFVIGNATNSGTGTCAANITVLRIH